MFSTFTLFFYCYITTQFLLNCHPLFSNNLHSDVGSCTWEDIRDLRESFQKLERHSDQCSHLFKKGMQVFNTIKGEKQVVNIISYIFISFRDFVYMSLIGCTIKSLRFIIITALIISFIRYHTTPLKLLSYLIHLILGED